MGVKEYFQIRLADNESLNKKFQGLAARVASVRVIVFLLGLLAFVYFVNERELLIALAALATATIVFILLVIRHNKLKFARDQYKYLADINSEEISRLTGDLSKIDNGAEFIQPDHSYVEDLDIFGDHSIFQLLNRTSTFPGKELLANRLKGENSVLDLQTYQKSVSELSRTGVQPCKFC